jgi:hypothetical protein
VEVKDWKSCTSDPGQVRPRPLRRQALCEPASSLTWAPGKAIAAGIDTWSVCWRGEAGSELLGSVRALATVQAGRAYLVPEKVGDHRVGWFPESGLVFAEGHPAGDELCRAQDLQPVFRHLLNEMVKIGIAIDGNRPAHVRRLDVAADVWMKSPSIGLGLLECVGGLRGGNGKVVSYRAGSHVQTVVLKSRAGRSKGRIYDKGGLRGGTAGGLIRFEGQWRFGNGHRPESEELDGYFLRERFKRRFGHLRGEWGFEAGSPYAIANRLGAAVASGRLRPSRARSVAGYLLLSAAGVDQGAPRTRSDLERESRDLGLSLSLLAEQPLRQVDVGGIVEECLSANLWL